MSKKPTKRASKVAAQTPAAAEAIARVLAAQPAKVLVKQETTPANTGPVAANDAPPAQAAPLVTQGRLANPAERAVHIVNAYDSTEIARNVRQALANDIAIHIQRAVDAKPNVTIHFADVALQEYVAKAGGKSPSIPDLIEYTQGLALTALTDEQRQSAENAEAFLKLFLPNTDA
jgi:hypothetical protein